MLHTCNVCNEKYHDEWLLIAHQELFHSVDINYHHDHGRPSIIQNGASCSGSSESLGLINEAFEGSIVRHFRLKNTTDQNLSTFLQFGKTVISKTLQQELKRLQFVKFGLILNATFTKVDHEAAQRGFITRNRTVIETTNVEDCVEECLQEIILKITEHEARGSGWSLLSVNSIDVRVHKHGYGDRGSSYIPLPAKILKTKSCINVQNKNNECFKFAMCSKFVLNEKNNYKPIRKYHDAFNKYNFQGMTYPVSVDDVRRFETLNPGVSINIFGVDERNSVYPLKIVANELLDHTDLLLIKDGDISHYVFIKNFNRLVRGQLTKMNGSLTICKRCFCFSYKPLNRGGADWLLNHSRLCNRNPHVRIQLPKAEKAVLKFTNVRHQYNIPIVIYADFEASLLPIESDIESIETQNRYQKHEPNSFCLLIKSSLSEDYLEKFKLSHKPKLHRGTDVAKKFVDELYDIAQKVEVMYKQNVPMKALSQIQAQFHTSASKCFLCDSLFTEENHKVADHDHLTGNYRGPACNNCNLSYQLPKFIPVVLHNLSRYDAHFIIPELGRDTSPIDVLATSNENFISFSKRVGKIKIKFIDSFRFMPSSLLKLTENLQESDLVETKKLVPKEKMNLVLRKGVFPYDYIDSLDKFEETSLPPKDLFYNKLNKSHISTSDYQHACKVWEELNIKTLGKYSDFYVTLDVTLLCDVMEEFRRTCSTVYGLDPMYYCTAPGLAWQAMLKETKCELELLKDIDMVLMCESAIRGGITQSVTRHVKANNKTLPDYDENKESLYLGYFDANNLYGYAMSMPLPYGNFKWVEPNTVKNIVDLPKNSNTGYIMECDLEYPESLHDKHYDFPLLPKTEVPPGKKFPKLMTTLESKTKYVAHYWVIQQAIEMGLKIGKIHRVIQFSQACWLKSYIDSNTKRRAAAITAFQKDFFKLMNNAIFGKTLENKRKHKNIKLVCDPIKMEKLVKKPNFKTSIIINENLVVVSMNKTVVKMDRPLYVGMSILDISKTHMYDFHYNKMITFYGRDRIGITYMDTDSFFYWIKTQDMYEDLRGDCFKNYFDFSDYPQNHPNYDFGINKKVLGKFKDELNSCPIKEIIALAPKLYAFKKISYTDFEVSENDTVIKKAKGVKNNYVKDNIRFEHYQKCLFENKTYTASYNNIRSFNHQLYSITEKKKSLSPEDDKRVILNDGIHTLPYGHYSLLQIDQ
jgi:hypothetical protein